MNQKLQKNLKKYYSLIPKLKMIIMKYETTAERNLAILGMRRE